MENIGLARRRVLFVLAFVWVISPASAFPAQAGRAEPPAVPVIVDRPGSVSGAVRVSIIAEKASMISVREAGREVARVRSAGGRQAISFRAADGAHTYAIVAIDGAGNVSQPSGFRVIVDGTPPLVTRLQVIPGTANSGATRVSLSTEPAAMYTITLAGRREVAQGTADSHGVGEGALWLPNGRYSGVLAVRDAAANTSRRALTLAVQLPSPAVRATRTSRDGASPVEFSVAGPQRSHGDVLVTGAEPTPYQLGEAGMTTVRFPLPDARYAGARVTLVDFQSRPAFASVAGFTVDTTAPALTVSADAGRAAHGQIAVTFTSEGGAGIDLRQGNHRRHLLSSGVTQAATWTVKDGRHRVTVVATDRFGNSTRKRLVVSTSTPLTAGDRVIALLALVFLLGLAIGAGLGYWRFRHRIAAWWRSRAQRRAYQEAVQQHQATVTEFNAAHKKWAAAHDAWQRRAEAIEALVHTAKSDRGSQSMTPAAMKLDAGERVYVESYGGLVEFRLPRGAEALGVVGHGIVTVTSRRVVFSGAKRREWLYDRLTEYEHCGPTFTLLTVVNRKTASGVDPGADAERVRLFIDLAIADYAGSRAGVVAEMKERLANHRGQEPRPPISPPPPPPPPPSPNDAGQPADQRAMARH